MSCDRFEKFDLGKIGEAEFLKHLETCSFCQEARLEDDKLLSRAKALKNPLDAPFLWTRIQQSLEEEMRKRRPKGWEALFQKKWKLFPAAAVIGLLLGSGLLFLVRPGMKGRDLLVDSSLRRIERRERRYERSILNLESNARPQMANMDLDLLLLYRDRLETIDEQIAQCKEALAVNSGNAHIRRYMLAAFQDKKDTLREIMRASDLKMLERILE